jgi:hypothetical protein
MKVAGQLQHPNLVQTLDARVEAGGPLLVMEFVEGSDLARVLEQRRWLAVPDACEVIRQAAAGLQYAHEEFGLVHRDLKPSNLMVTPEGCVKVLDMGLARFCRDHGHGSRAASGRLTSEFTAVGTVDYMAPEQWENTQVVDTRADIYSLGCTLYHLLAGSPPFSGPAYDTDTKKMMAHAQVPAPQIRERRPQLPAELAVVLDKMLAKQPDKRFNTPAEAAVALEPFTEGCDLSKLLDPPGTKPRPANRPAVGVAGGCAKPSHGWPRKRAVRVLAVFAGVVAVAVVAGVVALFGKGWFGSSEPVRIDALEVTLYRGEKVMIPFGNIGTRLALAGHVGEAVRVHFQLSRPAYCYLIAYNPDGEEQLCYPEHDTSSPQPIKEYVYPAGEKVFRFGEKDIALQAFILVASRKPLPPFAEWKAEAGDSAWKPVQGDGVWLFDGQHFEPLGSDRGQEVEFPGLPKPFQDVCRFLKDRPDIEAIRGLAFPVRKGRPGGNP